MEQEKELPEHCPLNEKNMDDNRRRWHIGREIPIATIVVLIIQTAGVVWLAATAVARVDFMKEAAVAAQIIQTAVDRRQDEDSKRQEDRIVVQLDKINTKLDQLADRVRR